MADAQPLLITETIDEEAKFQNLVLLCEASLKQEAFRHHVDRVFENYVFSHDQRINMATKAILYNCLVCEDDFEYDFKNKVWVRTSSDRYAFNEAMRKFNKIIYHDRRFRGRIPWVIKNVKEYFKMKLVKKYYAQTGTKPPETKPTELPKTTTQNKPTKATAPEKANKQLKPLKPETAPKATPPEKSKPAEQNAQPDADANQEEEPTA